jgi:hypothetical protein
MVATGIIAVFTTASWGRQCGVSEWQKIIPEPRRTAVAGFDCERGVIVYYGGRPEPDGGDTWEWDGDRWTLRATSGPGPRVGSTMVFDAARGRMVMFGGATSFQDLQRYRDTWTWDGTSWAQRATSGPSPRWRHAMAFDSRRSRVVLFGGQSFRTLGDTWEWDGSAWTMIPVAGPPPRRGHAMAFDPVRGVTVLFGGQDQGDLGDTWEWNGSAWREVAGSGPSARHGHGMAFSAERGKIVMVGGNHDGMAIGETWLYGAQGWTRAPDSALGVREDAAVVGDGTDGGIVLIGGVVPTVKGDIWRWREGDWARIADHPGHRAFNAGATDTARQVIVMCGETLQSNGRMETWEWDGRRWAEIPIGGPPSRFYHRMTYDSARGRVRLVGGAHAGIYMVDQWEWDGARWSPVNVAGPDGRSSPGLAYDSARDRTVLAGGIGRGGARQETWEFDGTAWRLFATPPRLARWDAAMAYDPRRGRTVLVGGYDGTSRLADTWEWDGEEWEWVRSSEDPDHPSARSGSGLAFDPVSANMLMFGGYAGVGVEYFNDTWAWNGEYWELLANGGPPEWRVEFMTVDPTRGRVVLYVDGSMWEWREREAPTVELPGETITLVAGRIGAVGVRASGSFPLGFSWSRDGEAVRDDAHHQGAATSSVYFLPARTTDAGTYVATVANTCGTQITEGIEVRVVCAADLDQDREIEPDDFFAFLSSFLAGSASADFDESGAVDSDDFFAYLAAYFAGCG